MKIVENGRFDEERAFYGSHQLTVKHCYFDGPADGESAFKECTDIIAENCFFNLRYPFWHCHGVKIQEGDLTQLCRAALWYSDNIEIYGTKLHGIKALRECKDIVIKDCDIISPEFGWSCRNINMEDTSAESEYFMLRGEELFFKNVNMKGKYSFQYINNSVFSHCTFDTKDAFWHGKNVTVKDSVINGEYLGWYSDGLTLENCVITGTQPFCYCKNLKLINCEMNGTDLCFEKSEVQASITSHVISVKNPKSGTIRLPSVGEIIRDDPEAKGEVIILKDRNKKEYA